MPESILKILLVIGIVAIGSIIVIGGAYLLISLIGRKNGKTSKGKSAGKANTESKKHENYAYDENADLAENEKFRNEKQDNYLLDLDDDESVENEKHYDEAQAEKEKALALKDKGNDVNWFSELAGTDNDEDSDFEKIEKDTKATEEQINNSNVEEEEQDNSRENNVNPFLFDDIEDDDQIMLNKGETESEESEDNVNDSDINDHSDNTETDYDSQYNQIYSNDDYGMESGEQPFKFEYESDTIPPQPKDFDKNLETPSDEELIEFINSQALTNYELNSNSLNAVNIDNEVPLNYVEEPVNEEVTEQKPQESNPYSDELNEKNAMIIELQQRLLETQKDNFVKTKEEKPAPAPTTITPIEPVIQSIEEPVKEEKPEESGLNRDRIKAEVTKQMQINKMAEKEEFYLSQIRKIQEQHVEELRKIQEQSKNLNDQFMYSRVEMENNLKAQMEQLNSSKSEMEKDLKDQINEINTSKAEMENELKSKIDQINNSKVEMENDFKNQIDMLNDSKDKMENDFKDQIERINMTNEEKQSQLISEINSLREQLKNASQNVVVQEVPIVQQPVEEPQNEEPEIEDEPLVEEPQIELPKRTDARYEELMVKLQNLETRLRAVDKALRNNKKEYVPLMKAQKYINENNDRFNRKSSNVAKLKNQLSKPKYADDKEKLAKYESEFALYEQLRIDMTRNKEYLDLHSSKLPILEKENVTLTKQHTELENQIEIIKAELKKYE